MSQPPPTNVVMKATAESVNVDARIDSMPRVPLTFAGAVALFLCFFASNYEIGAFALVVPSLLQEFSLDVTDVAAPVFWNLAGYGVGAYFFGYIADRWGRVPGISLTIAVLGISSFLSGFAWDLTSFTVWRFLAGAGMGAVLAVCSAYIGELAPANRRGLYMTKIFVVQAAVMIGTGFLSLWVLEALPEIGWRILLAFGGIVILSLLFVNRRGLVESPRWLVSAGHYDQAEAILQTLERNAWRGEEPQILPRVIADVPEPVVETGERQSPIKALLQRPYLGRLVMILSFWLAYYIAVYGFLSYTPLILEGLGVPAGEALLVTVLGRMAAIVSPIALLFLIERLERRTLIIQGACMMIIGLLVLFLPIGIWAGILGVFLVTLGTSWSAMPAYLYTAEIFATHSRGTAAAIADGVGHMGGAIAPFVVLPILVGFGAPAAVWVIVAGLAVSAVVVRLGPKTRGRSLADISKD